MLLTKLPEPEPSVVCPSLFSKVGVELVDHTVPLELSVPPPTSVIVPPLWALSTVISVIAVVVKVAKSISVVNISTCP